MPLARWRTLKEIESNYNVAANTIRWHINKGNVPKYHIKKAGNTWMINENWIITKYKKRNT